MDFFALGPACLAVRVFGDGAQSVTKLSQRILNCRRDCGWDEDGEFEAVEDIQWSVCRDPQPD